MLRTRLALIFILSITVFVAARPLSASPTAVTYYVSSSTGNDDNNGLSEGAPFQTIAKVNSLNLQPGDRVLLKCGDVWHAEQLVLSKSGTELAPIVISSYPPIAAHWDRGEIVTGDPRDAPALQSAGAERASCIVIAAEESMPTESATDARTLQVYTALRELGVRDDAVIVAQVFQDSVGAWIEGSQGSASRCVAVRTDLSIARALLKHVGERRG